MALLKRPPAPKVAAVLVRRLGRVLQLVVPLLAHLPTTLLPRPLLASPVALVPMMPIPVMIHPGLRLAGAKAMVIAVPRLAGPATSHLLFVAALLLLPIRRNEVVAAVEADVVVAVASVALERVVLPIAPIGLLLAVTVPHALDRIPLAAMSVRTRIAGVGRRVSTARVLGGVGMTVIGVPRMIVAASPIVASAATTGALAVRGTAASLAIGGTATIVVNFPFMFRHAAHFARGAVAWPGAPVRAVGACRRPPRDPGSAPSGAPRGGGWARAVVCAVERRMRGRLAWPVPVGLVLAILGCVSAAA